MSAPSCRVGIGVVCLAERVVIARRKAGTQFAGFLEFPGGKLLAGESFADGVRREVEEECGLRVLVFQLIHQTSIVGPEGEERLLQFHLCRPQQEMASPELHAPFRWLALAELHPARFPPANAAVLAWLHHHLLAKR